jgi:hypothetical protein
MGTSCVLGEQIRNALGHHGNLMWTYWKLDGSFVGTHGEHQNQKNPLLKNTSLNLCVIEFSFVIIAFTKSV